jgi:glycine/D-amino acid oxidase-like deaminating enzyme
MKEEINNEGWNDGLKKKKYPAVSGVMEKDVIIVGGGLAGVVSAYLLSKEGKRVALIEKDELGQATTHLTTAFLTQSLDTDFSALASDFGESTAKKIIASHGDAIDLIESIIKEHSIDCDFERCSNFVYANSPEDMKDIEQEADEAKKLGLKTTVSKETAELGFPNAGFMEVKDQAKFHPMKFLFALAEEAEKFGAEIFENSEVASIKQKDEKSNVVVKVGDFSLEAKWAISATYEPFHQPIRLFFNKGMYKSYVFEAEVTDMRLQVGTYEDTENPYHYIRVDKDGEKYRVIIGGEDHRKDIPVDENKNFNALLEYMKKIIPDKNFTIKQKWSGPILEPVDGLAYIGRANDQSNILYAFAFSGNGMTYSAIAGRLFADIIAGKKNALQEIYAADRLPHLKAFMQKGNDFAGEFFGGAVKNIFGESGDLDPKIRSAS